MAGYIEICDGLGAPVEVQGGLFLQFLKAGKDGEKGRFMEDYRLLPCDDGNGGGFACSDVCEYDAIAKVLDACARLAAFGYGLGNGKRKPVLSDLQRIEGLEMAQGGGFLHVDLSESYWYRRFLYMGYKHPKYNDIPAWDFAPGDRFVPPIDDFVIPSSGTFRYSADADETTIEKLRSGEFIFPADLEDTKRDKLEADCDDPYEILGPTLKRSITERRGFLQFGPVPNLQYDGVFTYESADSEAVFWTDSELIIRAAGDSPGKITRGLANALATVHTSAIWHCFGFREGWKLRAPCGLAALWADFVTCFARRPVTICDVCGRPVVSDKPPRGQKRKTCSIKCRQELSRRNRATADEQANPAQ